MELSDFHLVGFWLAAEGYDNETAVDAEVLGRAGSLIYRVAVRSCSRIAASVRIKRKRARLEPEHFALFCLETLPVGPLVVQPQLQLCSAFLVLSYQPCRISGRHHVFKLIAIISSESSHNKTKYLPYQLTISIAPQPSHSLDYTALTYDSHICVCVCVA